MSDTIQEVTSDARLCTSCESAFGPEDDRRYKQCATCRGVDQGVTESPKRNDDEQEALEIQVDLEKPIVDLNRSFYSLGVTEDAPHSYYTVGGVCFQKWKGEIVDTGQGRQESRDRAARGSPINYLAEKHVERILEDARMKIIRNYRQTKRVLRSGQEVTDIYGEIHTMKPGGRTFSPHDGDRPLGEFLWMVKVRDREDYPRRVPPTLVRRKE